jgi:hypothetical protein
MWCVQGLVSKTLRHKLKFISGPNNHKQDEFATMTIHEILDAIITSLVIVHHSYS